MSNKIIQIQPNSITNARYDYNQIENDIKYFIIEAAQQYMAKDQTSFVVQKDLFGNLTINLELKKICKGKNHSYTVKQAKELVTKPISYNYNKENKSYDVTTALVSSVIYEKNSGQLMLRISPEALPALLWLGSGFTSYDKNIVLALPSIYAKRMYELCSRWKDKGFFRISLEEFRKMLYVDEVYMQICDLKANVLDIAQKYMNEQADLTFTYEFRKENGSRSFNWLYFWISGATNDPKNSEKQKSYRIIFNFLYEIYRNSKAMEITDLLANQNELNRAADRITRLKIDLNSGKVKKHGQEQYIKKVLIDDFKIPEKLIGESIKAQKQREKRDDQFVKQVQKQQKKLKEEEQMKKSKAKSKAKITQTDLISLFDDETKRDGKTKSLGELLQGKI